MVKTCSKTSNDVRESTSRKYSERPLSADRAAWTVEKHFVQRLSQATRSKFAEKSLIGLRRLAPLAKTVSRSFSTPSASATTAFQSPENSGSFRRSAKRSVPVEAAAMPVIVIHCSNSLGEFPTP